MEKIPGGNGDFVVFGGNCGNYRVDARYLGFDTGLSKKAVSENEIFPVRKKNP